MKKWIILLLLSCILSFSYGEGISNLGKKINNLSFVNIDIKNINILIVSYKDSLDIAKQLNEKNDISFYNYALSQLYFRLESYNQSIEYAKASLDNINQDDDYYLHIKVLNNLGSIYGQIDENDIAEKYFQQIDHIGRSVNDSSTLAHNFINLGAMTMEKDPEKTLGYFDKAESYISKTNRKSISLIGIANNRGVLYKRIKEYKKAESIFKNALKIIDSTHVYFTVINSNLASTYLFMQENDLALHYIAEALKVPSHSNYLNNYTNSYRILSEIYINKMMNDSALKYFRLYQQYSDSLLVNKKVEYVSKLKVIYETDKLLQDVKEQKSKIEKYQTKILNLSLIVIFILLILSVFVIYYRKLQVSYKNIVRESVRSLKIEQENIKLTDKLLVLDEHENKTVETNIENNDKLFIKIMNLLEKDKFYTDQDFSINKVAEVLNTNRTYISQVINSKTGETFVNLVNKYRVKQAKKLLIDEENKNITLEAIGMEAGFKSTSTFNRVFKAETGVTPSFYANNKNV